MVLEYPIMSNNLMSNNITPIEKLTLRRFPKTKDASLKAWNSADEYLIEWISRLSILSSERVLIINDQFGALTCALSSYQPYYWTDSFLSKTAIENNLKANDLNSNVFHINQCEQTIPDNLIFDLVIIRIPKHNSLLDFQLKSLSAHIDQDTKIIAAGMTKEIHKSNLNLFEKNIGPTKTSLAKKKSRLIFSIPSQSSKSFHDLIQTSSTQYKINQHDLSIIGLPGVFSKDSLDIGTRVLLQYMPTTQPNQKLIDLGCGTGVLGTFAAKQNPELTVTFTDESWLAVESARQTFKRNTNSSAEFLVTNVLDGLPNNFFDHILCNPPFHQQNVQTLSIARTMFKESAKKLNTSGELRVVANRHLKYRSYLNQYFSKVEVISNDPKFVVWLASGTKL